MYCAHMPRSSPIGVEEAEKIAEKFVREKIEDEMKTSYHIAQAGTVTCNFAFTQNGVICYPDLMKVSVSQETGRITGFEAQGYVMHHFERDIKEPSVSKEQAEGKVSGDLKILSHELAIIPTDGKNEVFCHEFKCSGPDERHYIVYVNAETGKEERILILIENENGTLTI